MTEDSSRLAVEFPGVPSVAGPDFRCARLHIGGRRVIGDVELHLTPSGWEAHGHRRNVEFANVVLHVSLWRDGDSGPVAFNGRRIPELVLEPFLTRSLTDIVHSLGDPTPAADPPQDPGRLLDAEGDARLRAKVLRVERLLRRLSPQQVLYRECMSAMGYRQNRSQFEELAARLPQDTLGGRTSEEILAAMRWTAGFEASVPPWLEGVRPMSAAIWRRRGVRPTNHPVRRMQAAASIIAHTTPPGLLAVLRERLLDLYGRSPGEPGPAAADLVCVFEEWGGPWLGRTRAAEIVHSVVVPFFLALFQDEKAYEQAAFVRDFWSRMPSSPDNRPSRLVKGLIFGSDPAAATRVVDCVRRHQGLLGWYSRMEAP